LNYSADRSRRSIIFVLTSPPCIYSKARPAKRQIKIENGFKNISRRGWALISWQLVSLDVATCLWIALRSKRLSIPTGTKSKKWKNPTDGGTCFVRRQRVQECATRTDLCNVTKNALLCDKDSDRF
ncbi:unnamed protein product, partial [Heterotrigona itama]